MGYSARWEKTRKLVIERSLGWCEECGKYRGVHVHHKRYNKDGTRGGEPLEWLLYLCLLCHRKKHPGHPKMGRASRKKSKKKKKPNRGREPCAWCGNRYSPEKHLAICVKNGVDKRDVV